ncbi:hypothetical protein C8F01DRAFT_1167719 [Mycena amicta]|nr:hypothetical protein C8F01DRAFT_1167719 [Mycena amicta]
MPPHLSLLPWAVWLELQTVQSASSNLTALGDALELPVATDCAPSPSRSTLARIQHTRQTRIFDSVVTTSHP